MSECISYVKTPTFQASATHVNDSGHCHSYVKFPSPEGLRPRAARAWKVADLCKAYDFPTNVPGGGVIGILELGGGWTQSDMDTFSRLNGLPPIQVIDVSIGGAQNTPGGSADAEVALDIQVAAAAYFLATGKLPTIKVLWVENRFTSFADAVDRAVQEGCDVLSISWGADEKRWERFAPGEAARLEATIQAATAKGLVVFAASGDNASGDGDPGANVDMPSSCPHVIGCGGTMKTSSSETAWGTGAPDGQGTGGGYSRIFPPQPWQIGAPQGPGRMVPDVAADADPNTGYLIVLNGTEMQIGGTSAVAPLYAGLFAAFGTRLGWIAPTLWQNPKAFTDITSGSNGDFNAAIGPDPCTGLGVPIGTTLSTLPYKHGRQQHFEMPRPATFRAPESSRSTARDGQVVDIAAITNVISHTFSFRENANTPGRLLEQSVVVNIPPDAGWFVVINSFNGAFTTPDFQFLTERPLGQFLVSVGLRGNNFVCSVRLTDSNSDDPISIDVTALVVLFT